MAKTHSPYAPAYRRQMVELVRSGRTPGELAREFECSASAIRKQVAPLMGEARMPIFKFVESWYNPRRCHVALGDLSPNDFERSAAKAKLCAVRNAHRPARTVPGASRSGEPEGKQYPPGVPYLSDREKTLLPPSIVHLRIGGESPNPSTETGGNSNQRRVMARGGVRHVALNPSVVCQREVAKRPR